MKTNRQTGTAKPAKTRRRPTQSLHRASATPNAVDSLALPAGLLESVYAGLVSIYGSVLKEVFVYGSYARGSFDQESDIDIAAIVNVPRSQLKNYRHSTVALMSEAAMKYGKLVSITEIPLSDYTSYRYALPYYRNIAEEGVYMKTGVFDTEVSEIILSSSKARNDSDYDDFYAPDEEEAHQQIDGARRFLEQVDTYLQTLKA